MICLEGGLFVSTVKNQISFPRQTVEVTLLHRRLQRAHLIRDSRFSFSSCP